MFCVKCGSIINPTDKYCLNCGNKIEKLSNNLSTKTDKYVSSYNETNEYSFLHLIISIISVILSLIPIDEIFMCVVLVVSIFVSILNIVRYKKVKDKMLFISMLLSFASIYTSLGWIYYLIVK